MKSFISKPAGPRSLRRALYAALGVAAAASLCAADPGPAYRIGILKGNSLSVKENALNAAWVAEAENVSSFILEGDRIGVRRQDGAVLVKEGGLGAPWVQVAQQSLSFGLSGDRIAVLSTAGSLDVKEGALNARWVRVAEGTREFQMQGRRIGILMSGGALQLLDGSPGTTLVHEADNVQSFQLSGQRLGVLYRVGALDVKEGGVEAPWVREADGVRSFYLEGNRIGVLRGNSLDVKEGGLDAPWVREAEKVDSFILNGESMAMLQGGVLTVKSGRLDASWTWQSADVQKFQLHGPRIAIQKRDGTFSVKEEGLQTASWVWLSGGVRMFQLAVTGGTGAYNGTLYPPAPAGVPGDWNRDNRRGEVTKTLVLESPRGAADGRSGEVEVLFPPGYRYCRHTLSANRRAGPGGVSVISAEDNRLVFGVWSDNRTPGYNSGSVEITATVTGIRDNMNDTACTALPVAQAGCGSQACSRYLNAAESDNGMCMAASCAGYNSDRPDPAVCVYNLNSDNQAPARARQLVCRDSGYDDSSSGAPISWQRDNRRGVATATVQLESPPGRAVGWSKQVEVAFPAGYSYCSHSLSPNLRAGPGGVSIVSADANRLVFGVWTGSSRDRTGDRSASPAQGGVEITATVTGVRSGSRNNRSCTALPAAGDGCGEEHCRTYLDAGESDNGLCLPADCAGNRTGRLDRQVCVYNLRDDGQADERARQLACRGNRRSELPADWQRGGARGEATKTLQLESPRGSSDGRTNQVEVLFPPGYSYCRHTLSNVTRTGPGGVSIVAAEPGRLVFGVWSGRRPDGSGAGRVQATATVTAIRNNLQRAIDGNDDYQNDDRQAGGACEDLPEAVDGGCGEQACTRFLDAAESDNGLCQPATCGDGRLGRLEQPVCVYNLRSDAQTPTRARRLVCRNYTNNLNTDHN